ncbi:hypothetical protein COCSUDRAFT_41258 [Coccomyxa subellipsoidea C-169]|uniref:Uncharacterized protein n=1 Tax=Coccomyxa subellipsoidea (strain C-169) TaxID=574566 RepID=I0YZT7_COCSC|nr:hypothetical protein COCSUDRAFT_41258 [Coccomyxa subellipsoidea C-169]EIE23906.1 hypothetical protein COCSUDRAFT_41258 [Coccomyxa subellipsoidea C-169]|eukprot:XP_005648450.1 hypothetical protein COCSUDRAFT_41258 [Coccomyxa subellipsoidea C-169]
MGLRTQRSAPALQAPALLQSHAAGAQLGAFASPGQWSNAGSPAGQLSFSTPAAQSSGRGVRENDENDAAARYAEEGALSRPTKRARLGPQPGMSGGIGASQQDAGDQHPAPDDRSPASTSAHQRTSFAFPDGGGLSRALEQLTPAMPARASGGGHAPGMQPPERVGRSRDVVPDSEEEATPPDHEPRLPQHGAESCLEHRREPPLSQAAGEDGSKVQQEQHNGSGEGQDACGTGAPQPALECTPRETRPAASPAQGDLPGSADRERLLALAAAAGPAAAAALMESQRGSNSPNKRKLPLPRRPPDGCGDGCASAAGSPASQALSAHSRGSSGNRDCSFIMGCQRAGGPSQPSPLCPTRLNRDRPADLGSQPDAPAAAYSQPQSQAPDDGCADAGPRACDGSGAGPSLPGGDERAGEARVEDRVRLQWLRAVRALHRIARQRQALAIPDGQTWSSSVHVPIGGDSSADASHRQRSAGVPGHSSSGAKEPSAPHGSDGMAERVPGGSWNGGAAAGEGDRSACHLAADEGRDGQSNKRRRVGGGQEALSSQGEECAGQGASRQQVAGDQPEAHGGDREAGADGQSSPITREGDSDVDIGGPEDLLGQPHDGCSLACGHPLTQYPPRDACSQGRGLSQAAETQMCHMHSSEEQDPLCGQPLPPPHLSLEEFGRTPGALLLRTPAERSPWATPHFSHPNTTDRCAPGDPHHSSDIPVSAAPASGPPAASLGGQNATMRVLSLDDRPSPGWTPGLMCSGIGFQQATADAGGTAPDALHRLARRAPLTEVLGGPSAQQGSCQAPLMTQSGVLTPIGPCNSQEQQLPDLGIQGLQNQAMLDPHHNFETCHSLDGLLYGGSQNSDRALPLSGQPLPSPPN